MKNEETVQPNQTLKSPVHSVIRPRMALLVFVLLAAVACLLFREPLQSCIIERGVLANDSPGEESVARVIEHSHDPVETILSAWNTGKVPHQRVAVWELRLIATTLNPPPKEVESMVLAAAGGPDEGMREDALSILRQWQHPALASLAVSQLHDCDPQIRLMGLEYLRWVDPRIALPAAASLLDDTSPLLVGADLKLFEKHSRQKFGVRLGEIAAGADDLKTGMTELHEGCRERCNAGADLAKKWWAEHRAEFPTLPLDFVSRKQIRPKVANFYADTLDGDKLRLSDLRGKVVLLHFWITSRPGCLAELQDLAALQQKFGNRLAIVGVSLDNVPDSHGHLGGHEAGGHHEGHEEEHDRPSLQEIREKVLQAAKECGVNFAVILDEKFAIGGAFNATEIPNTIILDTEGAIRRDFVGRRDSSVLEAMISEALLPQKHP